MAVVHRKKARLPNGRALLYNLITDAYLEEIDARRRLAQVKQWIQRLANPVDRMKRWLARVGFEMQRLRSFAPVGHALGPGERPVFPTVSGNAADMPPVLPPAPFAAGPQGRPGGQQPIQPPPRRGQRNGGSEILASAEQVLGWLADGMRESGYRASDAEPGEFLEFITRRTGLLVPRAQDRLAFLHLSFQEYLAGCWLQKQIVSPAWSSGDDQRIPVGARPLDLREYANDHRWRETLIFLFELLATDQPDWLTVVWPCLFGSDFGEITPAESMKNKAVLLARLAANPHSGFDEAQRQLAIERCCAYEVADVARIRMERGFLDAGAREVWRALTTAGPDNLTGIVRALVNATRQAGFQTLDLAQTGITDLAGLNGLIEFAEIDLSQTRIADLAEFKHLVNLRKLDLDGTRVRDLAPLAALGNLEELSLDRTHVTDLTPLAALRELRELSISWTEVRDVEPLAQLPKLEWLYVVGTRLDDGSLAALNCKVQVRG